MAIQYRIYANDGLGGFIDYTKPIGTVEGLSFLTPPLAPSSDNTFLVRAFDTILGIEESNTDARVRIILDANGKDVSNRPQPPHAITAKATLGGKCRVAWAYFPMKQPGPPTGFNVYITPGSYVGYDHLSIIVPYVPTRVGYNCELSGLDDGVTYAIGVRAFNATAEEPNTILASVTGSSLGPDPVDALTAVTTFQSM